MNLELILSAIDDQIRKLQQARAMLTEVETSAGKRSVGRPKGTLRKTKKGRVLSAEARARIAEAQKKRWAAAKKAK